MIFHTLEFAEQGLSGILGSCHAQSKSTFLPLPHPEKWFSKLHLKEK